MPSEITITASLTASKGGASVATGTLSKILDMTGDGVQVQTVSVTDAGTVEIPIAAAIATLGQCVVKNLDDDYYVDLAYDDGADFAANQFARLKPGAFILWRPVFPTLKTKIYGQAQSGHTVMVGAWYVEE